MRKLAIGVRAPSNITTLIASIDQGELPWPSPTTPWLPTACLAPADTDHTTVLYVPSIELLVAGDLAYNGVHQYLLEGGGDGLHQWLHAIDTVTTLAANPKAVVAPHKQRDLPDNPAVLAETKRYLEDAITLLDSKPSALVAYEKMLKLHPNRINPGPLWYSLLALLGH